MLLELNKRKKYDHESLKEAKIWGKWKYISFCFYSIICFLWNMYLRKVYLWYRKKIITSVDAVKNQTSSRAFLVGLFKWICQEPNRNCDQLKGFSGNYKPIFRLGSKSKEVSYSLDKISILNRKLLVIPRHNC